MAERALSTVVSHDIWYLTRNRHIIKEDIWRKLSEAMASTSEESSETKSVGCIPVVESDVNLFTEPHNRMKELVSWPLTEAAEVSDVHELEPSLQAIYEAMWEMKTHEYIENHYIMDTLKQRLQSRRVNFFSLEISFLSQWYFCFKPFLVNNAEKKAKKAVKVQKTQEREDSRIS